MQGGPVRGHELLCCHPHGALLPVGALLACLEAPARE